MNRALIMKQLPKAASLKISKHNIPRKETKPFNQYEAIARNVFHFEIFFCRSCISLISLNVQKHVQCSRSNAIPAGVSSLGVQGVILADLVTLSQPGCGGRLCPPNNTGTPEFSDLPTDLNTRYANAMQTK